MASMTPSGAVALSDFRGHPFGCLMMGAVDRQAFGAGDPMQERARLDLDLVAGLSPRVGLLMRERVRQRIRDVLDQRPAEDDIEKLLAAANTESGRSRIERARASSPIRSGCGAPSG